MEVPGCELVGVHAHIGSQIFELAAFDLAVERWPTSSQRATTGSGSRRSELNLGGGLGIAHTEDELTPDPGEATARVRAAVETEFDKRGLPMPRVFGRARSGDRRILRGDALSRRNGEDDPGRAHLRLGGRWDVGQHPARALRGALRSVPRQPDGCSAGAPA